MSAAQSTPESGPGRRVDSDETGGDHPGYEAAIVNPSSAFEDPADVVNAPGFTDTQRMEILKRWEYDCREMAVAEEEGMGGGESAQLRDVLKAIDRLSTRIPDDGDEDDEVPPTKHG